MPAIAPSVVNRELFSFCQLCYLRGSSAGKIAGPLLRVDLCNWTRMNISLLADIDYAILQRQSTLRAAYRDVSASLISQIQKSSVPYYDAVVRKKFCMYYGTAGGKKSSDASRGPVSAPFSAEPCNTALPTGPVPIS
jgi:hypothetical protein